MIKFEDMELPKALCNSLKAMKFDIPTPIQAKAIPLALAGYDILGAAQTGTGKTGAFGIPLIAKLLTTNSGMALVLTPTRELAAQVMQQLTIMLGSNKFIKSALLIGGEPMERQLRQLRNNPRLIVGTPGRVNDHLTRKTLDLKNTNFLVLDETDRMLDMGFSIQINEIIKYIKNTPQTLLFSATMPNKIEQMVKNYMVNPKHVAVDNVSSPVKNIKQEVLSVRPDNKYSSLESEIESREGSIIIFVKTKFGADKMAKRLKDKGHLVSAIHGNLRQHKRDKVILAFRKQKCRILVATDIAARGLDIPHIEHVINYDLPQCAEDYIHRIGRTARGGSKGCAISLLLPNDKRKWSEIEKLLNPNAKSTNFGYTKKNNNHVSNQTNKYQPAQEHKVNKIDKTSNSSTKKGSSKNRSYNSKNNSSTKFSTFKKGRSYKRSYK